MNAERNDPSAAQSRLCEIYERGDVAGRALARAVLAFTSQFQIRTHGDQRLVSGLLDAVGRYTETSRGGA